MPAKELPRDKCGAKTRSGGFCKQRAGWGTDHPGLGRCKLHGGKSPIKHGRYSLVHRAALAEKAARFLSDPAPGDLTSEIALLRALLEDYLERFPTGIAMPHASLSHVFEMVESIGRAVERVSRILNQTALTQAELHVLHHTIANLLVKYLDDPDQRIAFLGELRTSLGFARLHSNADTAALTD